MNNERLRKRVKAIHAFQNVKYKEIAEFMEMSASSFGNWLNAYYDFGDKKLSKLEDLLNNLEE